MKEEKLRQLLEEEIPCLLSNQPPVVIEALARMRKKDKDVLMVTLSRGPEGEGLYTLKLEGDEFVFYKSYTMTDDFKTAKELGWNLREKRIKIRK